MVLDYSAPNSIYIEPLRERATKNYIIGYDTSSRLRDVSFKAPHFRAKVASAGLGNDIEKFAGTRDA